MRWFSFAPNNYFSPDFQEYMKGVLELVEDPETIFDDGVKRTFVDVLQAQNIDQGAFIELEEEKPWMHLTLFAACLHDAKDREHAKDIIKVFSEAEYVIEDLNRWMRDQGLITVWESLQIEHPYLKGRLFTALYTNLPQDWVEVKNYDSEIFEDAGLLPRFLARRVRQVAFQSIHRNKPIEDLRVHGFAEPFCTHAFLLNSDPDKLQKTLGFFQRHKDMLSRSPCEDTVDSGELLIQKWFYELARTAAIKGEDPLQIIEGGSLILRAHAAFASIPADRVEITVRQHLINALAPFPDAVRHLRPSVKDFFPPWEDVDNEHRLKGPAGGLSYKGADDSTITFIFRTLKALEMPFAPHDIDGSNQGGQIIAALLKQRSGRSAEIEQWYTTTMLERETYIRAANIFSRFDADSLSNQTIRKTHLYRAKCFINNPSVRNMPKSSVFKGLPVREGDTEAVLTQLLESDMLNEKAIRFFGFSGDVLKPHMQQLPLKVRRYVVGEDLGI